MYREKKATLTRAMVTIGRVIACQSPITVTTEVDWLASKLNSGNEIANTWRKISATANAGIAYKTNAALVAMLSPSEFRFTAWKTPSGKAIKMARIRPVPDR